MQVKSDCALAGGTTGGATAGRTGGTTKWCPLLGARPLPSPHPASIPAIHLIADEAPSKESHLAPFHSLSQPLTCRTK